MLHIVVVKVAGNFMVLDQPLVCIHITHRRFEELTPEFWGTLYAANSLAPCGTLLRLRHQPSAYKRTGVSDQVDTVNLVVMLAVRPGYPTHPFGSINQPQHTLTHIIENCVIYLVNRSPVNPFQNWALIKVLACRTQHLVSFLGNIFDFTDMNKSRMTSYHTRKEVRARKIGRQDIYYFFHMKATVTNSMTCK